jgi:hypothetical protein
MWSRLPSFCCTLIWEKGCFEYDLVGLTAATLTNTILRGLEYLDLSINGCNGHGCGSGANIVGVNSGVKTRTVVVSTRALSAPYGSHSWNLLLGVTAKSSVASGFLTQGICAVVFLDSRRRE